jgi:hypothetical protein
MLSVIEEENEIKEGPSHGELINQPEVAKAESNDEFFESTNRSLNDE